MENRESKNCYLCGGKGHNELGCHSRLLPMAKLVASEKKLNESARPTRPAFEFIVGGLVGAAVRDLSGVVHEIQAYGIEVTSDSLRLMVIGDHISVFGTPARNREFALLLPEEEQEIQMSWDTDRLSIAGRYAVSKNLFRATMRAQPFVHGEAEFTIICRGPLAKKFSIRYWVDGNIGELYTVNYDSRRQVWVVPTNMYEHFEYWFSAANLPGAIGSGSEVDVVTERVATIDVAKGEEEKGDAKLKNE